MTQYLYLALLTFGTAYFTYKLFTEKTNKGSNGFAAGIFLVILIMKLSPFTASLLKSFL